MQSWNFCTYAETKEYYETLRARHLPQKLKFWKENLAILPLQGSTLLIENYSQDQCHSLKNQCLKYDFIQNRWNRQTEKGFFPVTLKAPYLTLTQIILTFKYYRKDWNVNNTIYIIQQRASNKKSQSWQWVKWRRYPK